MDRKFLLVSCLAAALCSSAAAQITKSGSGYTLRAKYAKGQVIRFITDNGLDSSTDKTARFSFKIPVTLRVLGVNKRGVATVNLTMGSAKLHGLVVEPGRSITFPLDNRNLGGDTNSQKVGPPLPNKPIKVGGVWSTPMPFNVGGTTENLQGVYRFAGLKQVNGHWVGVITYSLSGPATGTGTMLMLVKDGTLYSNETKLSMSSMDVTRIHSKMTRLGN